MSSPGAETIVPHRTRAAISKCFAGLTPGAARDPVDAEPFGRFGQNELRPCTARGRLRRTKPSASLRARLAVRRFP